MPAITTRRELATLLGRAHDVVTDAIEAERILREANCPGRELADQASVAAARLREAEPWAREVRELREQLAQANQTITHLTHEIQTLRGDS
jgi:hypothetical protein